MFLFTLALFLGSTSAANDCLPNAPTVSCKSSLLVVLDVSNAIYGEQITNEFLNFKGVMQQLNANGGQNVGVMFVGNGQYTVSPLTSSYDDLCNQYDSITRQAIISHGQEISLYDLYQAIYTKYGTNLDNVLLYTTASNWNDIAFAGEFVNQFMPNLKTWMLSMFGWPAIIDGTFPYSAVIYQRPEYIRNQTYIDCMAGLTCGDVDRCNGLAYLPTPTAPPPTPDPLIFLGPGCADCDPPKVSADVMLMIENSAFTGADGLKQIQDFIKTSFSQFNVQTSHSTDPFHMRVGIYVYSSYSISVKSLGQATANDLATLNLPLSDSNSTDMMDCLWNIESEFKSANHRPNAARIIVVFATDFVSGYYRFPTSDFNSFISGGGRVIIYEVNKPGMNGYVLQSLTSQVNFINSTSPTALNQLTTAMCSANCICPSDAKTYVNDLDTGAPIAGCYVSSTSSANYGIAKGQCRSRGGFVAEADDAAKSTFLTQMQKGLTIFQGLVWDSIAQNWVYEDGRTVNPAYAPWLGSSTHAQGTDCTSVSENGKWIQTDCRNSFAYVCQIPPCDTSRAC